MHSIFIIVIVFFTLAVIGICYLLYKAVNIPFPSIANNDISENALTTKGNYLYFDDSFLVRNKQEIYELYTDGNGFERGIKAGALLKELKFEHEKVFIESIHQLVPNRFYLNVLKIIVGIFNRNLHKHIPVEYLDEIYGLSKSSSAQFNYIAPSYQRVLNYHAAHDIGHAMQNFGLVGCSSFVVKGSKSADGKLLLARNLDFSPSEGFNERKVLYFINPTKGNKYVSYSWPGFAGVVSGMNEHGLCVVLHATKSTATLKIGTPVSIIAKEILQYASNLEEVEAILLKRKTFVAEMFLVVSGKENSAKVFEKTPDSLTEFEMEGNELICTNHYLSKEKCNSPSNLDWKNKISSAYREEKLKELLIQNTEINFTIAANILRNVEGIKGENIGLQKAAITNENLFDKLMEACKFCSLGQITQALFEVGGQYRRNM